MLGSVKIVSGWGRGRFPMCVNLQEKGFRVRVIKAFVSSAHLFAPVPTRTHGADAEGSANWFLPEDPAAKDLFAVTLTRDDCRQGVLGRDGRRGGALSTDEAFCTTVSEGVLSYEEFVYIVERKYLEPATQIGPDPDEVLPPVVLVFESPDITSLGFEKETERMEAMARF